MIRRSLNKRFVEAVLSDTKTTTIRENDWPVGVPIRLFTWTGTPYRSRQQDVATVVVREVRKVRVNHLPDGAILIEGDTGGTRLHQTEGFRDEEDMAAWFRKVVPLAQSWPQSLMRFERVLTHEARHMRMPWIAIHVPSARRLLGGYEDADFRDIGNLMAGYCNLLENAWLVAEGKTEEEAVRKAWEQARPNDKLSHPASQTAATAKTEGQP
jgi:hypothetical protein